MEMEESSTRAAETPLDADEAPVVTVENPEGAAPYVLTCEHASNALPRRYGTLGLPTEELERHIGWDIGAAPLARSLAASLDAPLVMAGYSRLLVDCNRPPASANSMVEHVDGTTVPGNQVLSAAEKHRRVEHFFEPFHAAVEQILDARACAGRTTALVGVHSFTPKYEGCTRPWHAGLLYNKAHRFAASLGELLERDPALLVGYNQPYQIEADNDYLVPVHGDSRGVPALLMEIRQDLLAAPQGVEQWGETLTSALDWLRSDSCLQPVRPDSG